MWYHIKLFVYLYDMFYICLCSFGRYFIWCFNVWAWHRERNMTCKTILLKQSQRVCQCPGDLRGTWHNLWQPQMYIGKLTETKSSSTSWKFGKFL